jgi:cbb3-type cytochrome oxidase subunit 3
MTNIVLMWLTILSAIVWVFLAAHRMKQRYDDERISSLEEEMSNLRNHVNRIFK